MTVHNPFPNEFNRALGRSLLMAAYDDGADGRPRMTTGAAKGHSAVMAMKKPTKLSDGLGDTEARADRGCNGGAFSLSELT